MEFIGIMLGFAFVCFFGFLFALELFGFENETIEKITFVVGILCVFWIAYFMYQLWLTN